MFPVHLRMGPLFMPFYEGLYFALSVLLGIVAGSKLLARNNVAEKEYSEVFGFGLLGAIVGGRLFHAVFWNSSYFMSNPLRIFAVWEGGISITGGIAGGLIAALIVCRIRKADFWMYIGLTAPIILISQGLGRIGCFLNGDAFGIPSNLPWAVSFKRYGMDLFSFSPDYSVSSFAWQWCHSRGLVGPDSVSTIGMHPTQIYEAIFDVLFALALIGISRRRHSNRLVGYVYISGYSLFRFFIEFLRADREGVVIFDVSGIQILLLALALVFFVFSLKAEKKSRGAAAPG